MDSLSERYLGHTPIPIKPLLGSGKSAITFDRVPLDEAVPYAAEDADITLRLWQMFKPQLHTQRSRASMKRWNARWCLCWREWSVRHQS